MQHSRIKTSSNSKNSKLKTREGERGVAGHKLYRKNVIASGSHEHTSISTLCWSPMGCHHTRMLLLVLQLWENVTYPSCQCKLFLLHSTSHRNDAQLVLVSLEFWISMVETYYPKKAIILKACIIDSQHAFYIIMYLENFHPMEN